MSLKTGTRLGPYEIVSLLGAGGMGEVWRARDTRLGRDVAVKVLPQRLSGDDEMRQRFEREAKVISSLSHPNICALHDVGSEGEMPYLVMELIEGESLAERLARGALPADQAIRIAGEIGAALDAAHRRSIVHRDLKPANVMLTRSGAKLLDFGLARLREQNPLAALSILETATAADAPLTEAGTVLGTLAYMAPEQLEGKPSDSRADIFSFGAVIYEMLTGRRAFAGETRAAVISSILTVDPPPVTSVRSALPAALDRIVAACLAKEPEERWQSAADVGRQLRSLSGAAPEPSVVLQGPRRIGTRWLPWALTAVALPLAVAGLFRKGPPAPVAAPTVRFSVPPPADGQFVQTRETTFLAMSPDGAHLAFVAADPQGGRRVWLRTVSALEARPLAGTEGARSVFWSPDGTSLAFFTEGKLKRLDLPAGSPVPICEVPGGTGKSGTWGHEGNILFASIQGEAIYRVSASGGTPVVERQPDLSRDETRVLWPWFLPDGERFLYVLRERATDHLVVSALGRPARVLMPMASRVQYADPGYLVFAREGTLVAQRFDWRSGTLGGGPFSIAEHVNYFHPNGNAAFATSPTGTLAYQPREDVQHLAFFDRTGREIGAVGTPGNYISLVIAPDGRRMLLDRQRPETSTIEVLSLDLERLVETRVSSGPFSAALPLWLPGGSQVVYSVTRYGPPGLVRRDLATGREEELLTNRAFQVAHAVSPDGATLVYGERTDRGAFDLWTLSLTGGGKPTPLIQSPANKSEVRFSPDGRFIAFLSDESGRSEVYVTPFTVPGERVRVSTGGARLLRWSRDGSELLYLSAEWQLMSVPVRTHPALHLGAPTALFVLNRNATWRAFDVSPDGKRFLAAVEDVVAGKLPLTVVVNGAAEMRP